MECTGWELGVQRRGNELFDHGVCSQFNGCYDYMQYTAALICGSCFIVQWL